MVNKTPKIRFKDYTSSWEQRKLSDAIVDIADGPFGSNLKTEHYTDEKEARIIQLSNLSDYGWQEPNTRYTTFEHAKEIRRCIVNEGELIMGKMMPAGMTIIRPNTEKMYVLSSDCVRIKLDKNVATDEFFLYTTKSEAFLNQVNNDSQGSTRVRTSISKIREMDFATPSLEEQAKIGEYFTNLDNLITLQQREYDRVSTLKKAMLKKMFPKNGETKPEIRFSGFTDDWEQRKLGDIITEYKETVDSDCTLPILTSSKTEGVILQEEHFGRKQQHDITGYNILPRNYCTYRNRSDGVDFTFNINKCCDKGIISKFYPVFIGKNNDVFFLSLVLNNSEEVVREIAYTCTGTGQKVLSFLDLQKMKVRVPNFDEQKEIAAYFDSLDHLITLQQRKLEKLKCIKKSLLENMFV